MARYEHLRLLRLPERLERRKRRGFGGIPRRDAATHGRKLDLELTEAVESQRARLGPTFVDPSLILRVQMAGPLLEEEWENLGVTVVSSDPDRTLILCASEAQMQSLRQRVEAYSQPPPPGQRHPSYQTFISAIESIGIVQPRDRIGLALREEGFGEVTDFAPEREFTLDVELWDLGDRPVREMRVQELRAYVERHGGQALNQYVGPSISLVRVRASGQVIQALLAVEEVASVDLPPKADLVTADVLGWQLSDLPELIQANEDAPLIGVLDTGINVHPLLEHCLVGSMAIPESLGTADDLGHGTRVGSVAVFGDLRAQIAAGQLVAGARLCSAKVLDRGNFIDQLLVPSQMRTAIAALHDQYGCRLFVLALGDRTRPYRGGKVGTWAATLDEIARELDVLLFVSAGNRLARQNETVEEAVTQYPRYLLEEKNRLLEPGGALNVLTVGALAHGNGLDAQAADDVQVRPITERSEPAPFTRIGPGMQGAIKPDLVDFGGTHIFDAVVARMLGGKDRASAGMLTLHHRSIEQLFTSASGTSYAAPLVAHKAAQLLKRLPHASANLLRALLVGASELPEEAQSRLAPLGDDAPRTVCGHGYASLERAAYSDDSRVVLYAEDELPLDHFAVYEIPVPSLFQTEPGRRTLRVTLAFDPPVRHTRTDYAGVGMSFRVIRGHDPAFIFDHYRKRTQEDGRHPELGEKHNCRLVPGPQEREASTVQSATVTFQRNIAGYGDRYYLVARCESGWATGVARQRFALVVELAHEASIRLYEQLRVRLNV